MSTNLVNWREAFLIALEQNGSVTKASEAVGVNRTTAYKHKRNDCVFAKQWDEAIDSAADVLEDEARKRAFAGSDVLLMFLLKGLRPQRWRESRATIAPAELNRLIEAEFQRLAKAAEAKELVN